MQTRIGKYASKLSAILIVLLMGVGCDVEAEGEEGNFTFRYVDSKFTAGASDLAVGTQVRIEVVDADTEEIVELTEVFSEAPDVIEVVEHSVDGFVVKALAEETTRITAEATIDGEKISDSTQFRAAEVATVGLEGLCSDGLFATDSEARMRYRMYDAGETRLTGYGYYPLSIEPQQGGAIDEEHGRLAHLVIETGSEPGVYEVVSEIDGESSSFELVDAADIEVDIADIERDGESVVTTVDVEEQRVVSTFFLEVGEEQVCGPATGIVEVNSETPEVCEAKYTMPFREMLPLEIHAVEVTGIESGDCEVTLALPDAEFESTIDVAIR